MSFFININKKIILDNTENKEKDKQLDMKLKKKKVSICRMQMSNAYYKKGQNLSMTSVYSVKSPQ